MYLELNIAWNKDGLSFLRLFQNNSVTYIGQRI